jgi:hypothetical protein
MSRKVTPIKQSGQRELPEEMKIVIDYSLHFVPCEKFRRANIYRFADHMKNDKC